MQIKFESSFQKDLKKLKDKKIKTRLLELIQKIKETKSLTDLKELKKLAGFSDYYRIRIDNHRLGLKKLDDETVVLIRFLNRKDIYKKFP